MTKKERIITMAILKGEPLYKNPNTRIQLLEYYLDNQDEFKVEEFNTNVAIEFRNLSLQGKIKRHITPLQWEKAFIKLEAKLDIEFILGKDINVEKLNNYHKKCSILEVIVSTQEKMISILNKVGYSQADELRMLELKEDLDLYNKLLGDVI